MFSSSVDQPLGLLRQVQHRWIIWWLLVVGVVVVVLLEAAAGLVVLELALDCLFLLELLTQLQ
jgi:ABC-type branched-subunit amino acid transport system permease subunit